MVNVGEITRREFIKATGLLAGGLAIGSAPFLTGCGFPAAPEINAETYSLDGENVIVLLDKIPKLSRVGGSAAIINTSAKINLIIARIGEDNFIVALNECPHREKLLGYDHKAGTFICASGKSEFRLDGSVISGPAENSLPIYR
jgi:nitrite reductase/ring-hydroxylating ferredoxin subunit